MRFLFDKSAENLDEGIHTDFNYDHLPVSIFSEPIRILSAFWMDAKLLENRLQLSKSWKY